MAIDKSVNQAPVGLEEFLNGDTPEAEDTGIEIEIEDPDGVEIEIEAEDTDDTEFDENLVETLDADIVERISSDLLDEVEADIASRKDWVQTYIDGIELLGLKMEDRTEPWEGACAVYHPLLTEAVVKFQAETMMETFPPSGPVKTQIVGKQTQEKENAAARVKEDMNYQLTQAMPEYRPEHERMLWGLGLAGNAFKKVYFDPAVGRQVSIYVPAEDVVVPYGASDLQSAPRVTHIMRKTKNELRRLQVAGFYADVDLGDPSHDIDEVDKKIAERMGFSATEDDRYKVYEIHTYLDIEGHEDKDEDGEPTGIAVPYVVTIEKGTGKCLAIRRNWLEDDELKAARQHFVHYGYIPGFGFYHFGLVHLIGGYAKSGTMLLRQLVDAGTLSNLPGGFKTNGLRIKGDDTPIAPAEFRDVDVPSGTIRDNILPLPYKEPSQVLQSLMNQIIEEGRAFANAADLKVSDMSAQAPVGTTLAILERSLKSNSAIQARIHYSMRQELQLLKNIIRDYTPDDYEYDPATSDRFAKRTDYDIVEIMPVSDPNAATMSQKVVQYQAVMQMAQQNPQIYDQVELNRQMCEVLGVKNVAKLIPTSEDAKPKDPVSENMAVITGKPVKAFMHQNHQAHIQVHMAAMQDPKILEIVQKSPNAQAIMAAATAHINEHVAFEYRKQIEMQLGVSLPDPDEQLSPEIEDQIAVLSAQAAQQLLQQNQAQAAQQQAQQQAQDPLVQMQQRELELREREVTLKEKESFAKATLDQQRIEAQERIAGINVGAKLYSDSQKLDRTEAMEGMRLGMQAMESEKSRGHQSESEFRRMNNDNIRESQRQQSATKNTPDNKENKV